MATEEGTYISALLAARLEPAVRERNGYAQARVGITVITANRRDFGRLAEFRIFQWRVTTI